MLTLSLVSSVVSLSAQITLKFNCNKDLSKIQQFIIKIDCFSGQALVTTQLFIFEQVKVFFEVFFFWQLAAEVFLRFKVVEELAEDLPDDELELFLCSLMLFPLPPPRFLNIYAIRQQSLFFFQAFVLVDMFCLSCTTAYFFDS